jgi:diamine N-acetyltransferase
MQFSLDFGGLLVPIISVANIYLREIDVVADDMHSYLGWLRDVESNPFIQSSRTNYNLPQLKAYVDLKKNSVDALLLGIFLLSNSKFIGTIKLEPINFSAKTTWLGMLIGDVPSRGQGYGFEALNAVLGYAFNVLRLEKVFLGVDKMNGPAIHLYSKIGFQVIEENESSFTMSFDSIEFKLE